jgi:flagellar basal-body rod protein FlgB
VFTVDVLGFSMPILKSLEQGLDYSGLRAKVLQHNIANIDTPNFKRSDLNFELMLNQMMDQEKYLSLHKTHAAHLSRADFSGDNLIYQDMSTSKRNDNNNVDPDIEMTRMAENTYTYMYLSRAITSQLNMFRQAYSTQ